MQGKLDRFLNSQIRYGLFGIPLSVLGVVGYGVVTVVGEPLIVTLIANACFTAGLIYLTGLAYGIIHNVIGSRANLPFYLLGHEPYQLSLIRSNSPNLQGIAWGIYHAFPPAGIAAAIGGLVAMIATIAGAPVVGFAVPAAALSLPILMLTAHVYAGRRAQCRIQQDDAGQLLYRQDKSGKFSLAKEALKKQQKTGQKAYSLDDYLKSLNNPSMSSQFSAYQREGLIRFSNNRETLNTWMMSGEREDIVTNYMPVALLASFVIFLLLTSVGIFLPPILLGIGVSVYLPLCLGAVLALGVSSAGFYMYSNQNKQIDSQFKLDWPELKVQPQGARLLRPLGERKGVTPHHRHGGLHSKAVSRDSSVSISAEDPRFFSKTGDKPSEPSQQNTLRHKR